MRVGGVGKQHPTQNDGLSCGGRQVETGEGLLGLWCVQQGQLALLEMTAFARKTVSGRRSDPVAEVFAGLVWVTEVKLHRQLNMPDLPHPSEQQVRSTQGSAAVMKLNVMGQDLPAWQVFNGMAPMGLKAPSNPMRQGARVGKRAGELCPGGNGVTGWKGGQTEIGVQWWSGQTPAQFVLEGWVRHA